MHAYRFAKRQTAFAKPREVCDRSENNDYRLCVVAVRDYYAPKTHDRTCNTVPQTIMLAGGTRRGGGGVEATVSHRPGVYQHRRGVDGQFVDASAPFCTWRVQVRVRQRF